MSEQPIQQIDKAIEATRRALKAKGFSEEEVERGLGPMLSFRARMEEEDGEG